jgi:hypothetical protein
MYLELWVRTAGDISLCLQDVVLYLPQGKHNLFGNLQQYTKGLSLINFQ